MARVVVKKTYDVTKSEWEQIAAGFNEEFDSEKTTQELIAFYSASFCGYSYHGLRFADSGELIGYSTVMPYKYSDREGPEFLVGLSGGSFVKKSYRKDIFVLSDVYKALRASCKQDGFVVILGVPNQNAFQYLIKLLRFKFLYNLAYYVLPLSPKSLIKRDLPTAIRWIWKTLIRCYIKLIEFTAYIYNPIAKSSRFAVSFTEESFARRFSEKYNTVIHGEYKFTYRLCEEKGLQTAYLFEFSRSGQRSLRALTQSVYHIASNDAVDLILFVGKLEMKQCLLFKIPQSLQPKILPLTIDVLVEKSHPSYESFIQPSLWDFGLLNLDVR